VVTWLLMKFITTRTILFFNSKYSTNIYYYYRR